MAPRHRPQATAGAGGYVTVPFPLAGLLARDVTGGGPRAVGGGARGPWGVGQNVTSEQA